MDQPTTSIRNEEENATTSTDLASGLTFPKIADLSIKKDEHVLRCHGFKSIFIPCERLEFVYQRDRKDIQQLRQISEVKEKKVAKNKERRRKNKEAYRDDSDRDEREKKSMFILFNWALISRLKFF